MPKLEGIVIGYTYDHNDVVKLNTATGIAKAFVGEGICADLTDVQTKGLQFHCNTNSGNPSNIISRKAQIAETEEQAEHTIRAFQGTPQGIASYGVSARNIFDQWACGNGSQYDMEILTLYAPIHYFHRDAPGHEPVCNVGPLLPSLGGVGSTCRHSILLQIPPDPVNSAQLITFMQEEKVKFGNTRYQYEQLIDEGNTDGVVQEIIDSWPQDVWELRDHLLDISPYMSVEALREVVLKESIPDAIKVEICIANPEATQKEGFVEWLRGEQILPMYLIGSIMASWDERTYRFKLESEMADRHYNMTQAVNELVHYFTEDSLEIENRTDSLLWTWQQLRTTSARYAEALLHMEQKNFDEANSVIESITVEHKLRPREAAERDRMLAYINVLRSVHQEGRSATSLKWTEIDYLAGLSHQQNDRPARWINNLLCHYEHPGCRPPYTGGNGRPKMLNYTYPIDAPKSAGWLKVHPNPATSWVAFDYELDHEPAHCLLIIRDITGRIVHEGRLAEVRGQYVMDSRSCGTGAYTVEVRDKGTLLMPAQKLILQ